MEPTFYEDDMSSYMSKDSIISMKRSMTLDLASPRNAKKFANCLLNSPDLNMLKLGSPELEKLIIDQNGLVTTTPTPTQFMYTRPVTEEQEVYARGFTDALAELQSVVPAPAPNQMYIGHGNGAAAGMLVDLSASAATGSASITTLTSLQPVNTARPTLSHEMTGCHVPNSVAMYPVSSSTSSSTSSSPFIPVSIKDEPQTVPSMGNTPPVSPINMESQEIIKLERKRQRNRVAASKCRRRKLERIANLETKVRIMKQDNSELSSIVSKLKEQVCALKQEVMRHSRSGCQIMTTDLNNATTGCLDIM